MGLDGLPLVGVLWHLDNALLLALDDLDDIAELLTWLVDVLDDKSWDKALDDFRDFLDLVERDLNDLLDVPDLRELDDLLDLLEDWERKLGAPRELTPGVADQGVHDDEGRTRASVSRHNMTGTCSGGRRELPVTTCCSGRSGETKSPKSPKLRPSEPKFGS